MEQMHYQCPKYGNQILIMQSISCVCVSIDKLVHCTCIVGMVRTVVKVHSLCLHVCKTELCPFSNGDNFCLLCTKQTLVIHTKPKNLDLIHWVNGTFQNEYLHPTSSTVTIGCSTQIMNCVRHLELQRE